MSLKLFFTLIFAAGMLLTGSVSAEIVAKDVEYSDDAMTFQGYIAYNDELPAGQPGVLVVHQWKGLTDYEKRRARELAELGYVAFAVDVYGKGVRPATNEEASAEAGKYYKDRELFRSRLTLGYDQLKRMERVDSGRLAAIGYCFGGGGVLALARTGADLKGVVSFHGSVAPPEGTDASAVKGKVLVCHGADDPYSPIDDVVALKKQLGAANVDYYIMLFGGAVHSFTQPMAGDDPSKGAAYDAMADARSWTAMRDFFDEIFAE